LNRSEIDRRLAERGVLITGSHIVYTSGKHGPDYFNKDAIYPDVKLTSAVCLEIAHLIREEVQLHRIQDLAIVAPAVGAVALSQWTAEHLFGFGIPSLALYADKEETAFELDPGLRIRVGGSLIQVPSGAKLHFTTGKFVVKRGYDKEIKNIAGWNVVVVEDILNTGGSAAETVKAVRAVGGNVVMVAAICNRGGVMAEQLDVPHLDSVYNVKLAAYEETECPLCRDDVPINTSVGHGNQFLQRRSAV
jgi:orotate phosphoribosyltransferase